MEIIIKNLLNILSSATAIVIAYFVVRAITKNKKLFVNKFFKGIAILFLAVVTITVLTDLFLWDEPDVIEPAVAYVKKDPKIMNLIGKYEGYSYNKNHIPKDSQEYGIYNFTVSGSQTDLSMDCYVSKNSKGDWSIVKISNQQLLERK